MAASVSCADVLGITQCSQRESPAAVHVSLIDAVETSSMFVWLQAQVSWQATASHRSCLFPYRRAGGSRPYRTVSLLQ